MRSGRETESQREKSKGSVKEKDSEKQRGIEGERASNIYNIGKETNVERQRDSDPDTDRQIQDITD